VRDDQANVRELLLDLHDLREIDGVLQPPVARDVEHHDRAHLVHLLELRLREEFQQLCQKLFQVFELLRGKRVSGMPFRVQSAFIANAYAVPVEASHVCTRL